MTSQYGRIMGGSEGGEEYLMSSSAELELSLATVTISLYGISPEEKILSQGQLGPFNRSSHGLILALLLPALLKMERLVLDLGIHLGTLDLEHMLRNAVRREKPIDFRPPFESLTSFVNSFDMPNSRSAKSTASLLKLPAIQEISGYFKNRWGYDHHHPTCLEE